ncbi:ABC transporter DrrB family efflux protein [Williamsia limnetica]|uniref:Transport permease protein n=1 Tax=Williamsia limnetica TaxID=882452 RepID=A0A318RUP8_WILLI|nr:ABC transporter DrrB family efflux protein [Williamsia limnetica]
MSESDLGTPGGHSRPEPRLPRHRGDDAAPIDHWWRTNDSVPRTRRRAAPDDEPTTRFDSADSRREIRGIGSRRTMVGPWTMLSPGAATSDWTAEQIAERQAESTTRGGPRRDRQITSITDRESLDFELSPELQAAETERLDLGQIAARSAAADAAEKSASGLATHLPAAPDTDERGLRAYLGHTKILTGRQLRVVTRDRLTLMQSMLFPLLSMVMFKVVLGDAVGQATGQNSAFGTVPLVVLVGAMFGSLAVGTRLISERRTGLLTRLYVLPVHRAADLTSRINIEMFRILASTLVLTTAGMLIGWRFNQGVLPAIGIFAVALLYGAAYSTIVLTMAVSASNAPLVPIMSLCTSLLMFFNSGFSPIEAYPEILQPLVRNQPMTCAIETMRALATGGPIAENLTKTIAWAVAIMLIFIWPAMRGYRRAAASRT